MPRKRKIALACYAIPTAIGTIYGIVYATASKLLPYHEQALGVAWHELEPRFQALFLAFLHVAGANLFAATLCLWFLLLVPFRRGDAWTRWAIPVVGAPLLGPPAYIGWRLAQSTGASSPWWLGLVCLGFLLLGLILTTEASKASTEGSL